MNLMPTNHVLRRTSRTARCIVSLVAMLAGGWSLVAEQPALSWSDLLEMPLPSFVSGRDASRHETLGQQFAVLEKTVMAADSKHRRLPIYLSPRAALLPVRASAGGEITKIPTLEAVRYLCKFSRHKLKITITEHGILISTDDELR